MTYRHYTVLKHEAVSYLNPQPGGIYVDATFGGGGHTRAILEAEPTCTVLALDWDIEAFNYNAQRLVEEFGERFLYRYGNFAHLPLLLKKEGLAKVHGILADFGTSQYQITQREGFSFKADTPLDMRMSKGHYRTTAAHMLNSASEEELTHIFFMFGEEPHARKIARAICKDRVIERFKTTRQLASLIERIVPWPKNGTHPATRVFQALRIAVNHELDNIQHLLEHGRSCLLPGGRMVCISFHSLEDRLVKHFFKDHTHEFKLLTPHVVEPTPAEVAENPSSRSAKLRAAERL